MDFGQDKEEVDKAIKAINARKPDILVLSLGSPKQEKFLYKYKDQMEFGVALPVGAAVDFEAGNVNRAPKWMRSIGLEWFYRFLQEPGRLFKRYFIDDMKIFYLAWKYRNEVVKYRDEDSI
jgi:exopolysaccharide biosynthesis WecB/TagA/CpsF family protein